jgi:uncharacterized membrane protein YuzA (DUF378 family)
MKKSWKNIFMFIAGIGALNWGLTELGFNLVEKFIGSWTTLGASITYYFVGICGFLAIFGLLSRNKIH